MSGQIRFTHPKIARNYLAKRHLNPGISIDVEIERGDRTGILVMVRAEYDTSATKGVRVYYLYSVDGSNYDNRKDAFKGGNYFEPSFEGGGLRQRSEVTHFVAPYLRINIENLDQAYGVNVWLWTSIIV